MSSTHSIVQLEIFVKLLSSKNLPPFPGGDRDVKVLSRNPDRTKSTIWGPPLFRPSGAVIYTYHPDTPQRRKIEVPSLHRILRSCKPNHTEWVTDERWYNPAIRLEFHTLYYEGLPGRRKTYIFVFCFDTFHDDAGVCHWIIDTLYVDVFGLEDIIFPCEYGGKWNLSHKEATLWVEEMVRCSQSTVVDTIQVGQNLFTDSSTPLIWGPPLSTPRTFPKTAFLQFLLDLRWATRRPKYTLTGPNPSSISCAQIVLSFDKIRDCRCRFRGRSCVVEIEFILEVQANVRKIILRSYSFRHQ